MSITPALPQEAVRMPKALTTKAVEAIQPGTARREIPDAHMPGLYLVVQPSGARSWAVRYRHAGKPRKHTLGTYPALALAEARGRAGEALRAVAGGRDPASEKKEAKAAAPPRRDTIEEVAAAFIERY